MAEALRALPPQHRCCSDAVQQVCDLLQSRYAENISLAGIAAQVFLQPNYLTTLFRKEMGIGFVQYLKKIRIEQSCRLLLCEPGLTMAAIAPKCGFPSERYFFSTFKKFTGNTPGEFREEMVAYGFIRE